MKKKIIFQIALLCLVIVLCGARCGPEGGRATRQAGSVMVVSLDCQDGDGSPGNPGIDGYDSRPDDLSGTLKHICWCETPLGEPIGYGGIRIRINLEKERYWSDGYWWPLEPGTIHGPKTGWIRDDGYGVIGFTHKPPKVTYPSWDYAYGYVATVKAGGASSKSFWGVFAQYDENISDGPPDYFEFEWEHPVSSGLYYGSSSNAIGQISLPDYPQIQSPGFNQDGDAALSQASDKDMDILFSRQQRIVQSFIENVVNEDSNSIPEPSAYIMSIPDSEPNVPDAPEIIPPSGLPRHEMLNLILTDEEEDFLLGEPTQPLPEYWVRVVKKNLMRVTKVIDPNGNLTLQYTGKEVSSLPLLEKNIPDEVVAGYSNPGYFRYLFESKPINIVGRSFSGNLICQGAITDPNIVGSDPNVMVPIEFKVVASNAEGTRHMAITTFFVPIDPNGYEPYPINIPDTNEVIVVFPTPENGAYYISLDVDWDVILIFLEYWLFEGQNPFDVDGNGKVDLVDLFALWDMRSELNHLSNDPNDVLF